MRCGLLPHVCPAYHLKCWYPQYCYWWHTIGWSTHKPRLEQTATILSVLTYMGGGVIILISAFPSCEPDPLARCSSAKHVLDDSVSLTIVIQDKLCDVLVSCKCPLRWTLSSPISECVCVSIIQVFNLVNLLI